MGSTSTVTAAMIAKGYPQLLPGFFALAYLAVSVPVVALGAAASRFGVAAAFSGFGLLVALLAMVAGAIAVRRGRPSREGPLLATESSKCCSHRSDTKIRCI
ncbi:hypothetical protein [Streptomyces sp. HC307]|uniref:hypothetical protein n=1 Tax=Streptomyces flavusporus TaxID=3385496 RepID=UPI003916D1F0